MRLFIAEKPELGRAIAEALEGAQKNNNGYIEKGNDIVTWAFGHILELAEPEMYDESFKQWKLSDLPLPIKKFKYIPKEKSKEQLKTICSLINDNKIDSIVNCGDADDEGQILIDEIIEYSKTKKPIFRVLINDLTPKAVREEISKMKSNSEFKGMSERGFARSQADWIVGINLTRAYTIKARANGNSGILSVGRVQTPILGLIVARDKEFESFKSVNYYSLAGKFISNNKEFNARLKTEEKILDEELAKNIQSFCQQKNSSIHTKLENKKEYPPLPYNLLILQAECAKIFGFNPDKTMQITQSLREKHKAITYNRSDCQYLPENMFEESPKILETIKENLNNDEINTWIANSDISIKSKAFNDANITAHYGIIPTQNKIILSQLTPDELAVYTLIAKRFIIQFFNPREYQSITLTLNIENYQFTTTQNKTIKQGFKSLWKDIEPEDKDDKECDDQVDLFSLKDEKIASCISIDIEKKQTKPRPYYTMTTLLKDLNSVAKYVTDEKIKKLLIEKDKDKKGESGGIGTPATRSNHIKTLIDREYIKVSNDKKQIIKSTDKGRKLIELSPPSLSTPDMTALWFEQQKMIEANELSREDFLNEVTKEVSLEIQRITNSKEFKINQTTQNQILCPKCQKGYMILRKGTYGNFFSCNNYNSETKEGCKHTMKCVNGKPVEKELPNITEHSCPKCQSKLIKRSGISKNKKPYILFLCSAYPKCNYSTFADGEGNPKF